MLLRGAGLLGVALPFLPSLARRAQAAGPTVKRFIGIAMPYGTVNSSFFPADSKRMLAPLSARAAGMRLSDIAGDVSTIFEQSTYENLLAKMILLDGIDGPYVTGHEKTFAFTGYAHDDPLLLPGKSIDQIIADEADIYQTEPIFRSLNFAGGPDNNTHAGVSISYTTSGGAVAAVPQITNPSLAWDYLFKNIAQGPDADAAFEQLKAQKLSVLDAVSADYQRLVTHDNLSRADQLRLEAHLAYLREFELSVEATAPITCTVPTAPEATDKAILRLPAHMINIAHALRCGLTNVVTLSLEANPVEYPTLGVTKDHHGLSHGKDGAARAEVVAQLDAMDRFHMEQVASLLELLDVVEEPDTGRTFLDNSIVMIGSDMGSVSNHKGQRMPCVLFGGTGVLEQDLLVDYRSDKTVSYQDSGQTDRIGISYNNVLLSVCQAFGLTPEQYEQGQLGIGNYAASKYYYNKFASQADYESFAYGDRRTRLAEIFVG
jgi:hypothetical protein